MPSLGTEVVQLPQEKSFGDVYGVRCGMHSNTCECTHWKQQQPFFFSACEWHACMMSMVFGRCITIVQSCDMYTVRCTSFHGEQAHRPFGRKLVVTWMGNTQGPIRQILTLTLPLSAASWLTSASSRSVQGVGCGSLHSTVSLPYPKAEYVMPYPCRMAKPTLWKRVESRVRLVRDILKTHLHALSSRSIHWHHNLR